MIEPRQLASSGPGCIRQLTVLTFLSAFVFLFVWTASEAQQIDTSKLTPKLRNVNPALTEALTGKTRLRYPGLVRKVVAIFPTPVLRKGLVNARNAQWNCQSSLCSTTTISVPKISMCREIVAGQQQGVIRFGSNNTWFSPAQLKECNRKSTRTLTGNGLVQPVGTVVIHQELEPDSPGPNGETVDLIDQFVDRWNDAGEDFLTAVGWSQEIWQDGEDPNVFYFVPVEYRLQMLRTGERPLALGFTYTYQTETQGDNTVLMTATFVPPATDGDLVLMEALANSAIEGEGGSEITLKPFPVDSVEIQLADELAEFGIKPEDIRVTNVPRNVRDPVSLRIRMSEVAQTTLLSLMREPAGVSGLVVLNYGDTYSVSVPLVISMRRVSGYPLPDMRSIQQSKRLSNVSFMPITLKGIVGYVKTQGAPLLRKYRPMNNRPTLAPREEQVISANVANSFGRAFGSTGVVHSWFDYEIDTDCAECFSTVRRMAESQVGLTRKDEMTIEVPDFVFSNLQIFKVVVKVRSNYFDSSGTLEEIREYQLRPGSGIVTEELFLDRSRGVDEEIGSYQLDVYYETGDSAEGTDWIALEGTNLTLMNADLQATP